MLSFLQMINKKIKKIVTLQVRAFPPDNILIQNHCRKRVLPSAFLVLRGSLTIEAAISLPIFIFAVVTLLSPIKILNQHRKVQTALERSCEEISQYVYAYAKIDIEGNRLLERAVVLSYVASQLSDHADQKICSAISLSDSEILEDGETISLVAEYYVRLPISLFGLNRIKLTNISSRRAWLGKDNNGGETGLEQGDDEKVYIGKNSVRYHRSRECHYLHNNLQSVNRLEIDQYRNQSGSKYKACKVCKNAASGVVYIMPSGTHFHSNSQCLSIIAYIQEVELSKVEHLGACSYCSGG